MNKLLEIFVAAPRENFAMTSLLYLIFLFLFVGTFITVILTTVFPPLVECFLILAMTYILGMFALLVKDINKIETRNW
jgi:hypothetical protein